MLTLKLIQENKDFVIERLKVKNFDATAIVDKIIAADNERKSYQAEVEALQQEMNVISRSVGELIKSGRKDEAEAAKARTSDIKAKIKALDEKLTEAEREPKAQLVLLSILPSYPLPEGRTAADNVVVYKSCDEFELPAGALPHWELIKKYDIIDFDLGIKVTGAGFPFYKGKGARLQRALISFFRDEAAKGGCN